MTDFMDFVEIASTSQRGDMVVVVLTAIVPEHNTPQFINDLAEQFIVDLMIAAGVECDKLIVGGDNGTRP